MPFIPERLRLLREAKGWKTQLELEVRSGVDHSQITRYERGKAKPNAETIERLAAALDATTDYLYGRGPTYSSSQVAACSMALDVFCSDPSVDARTRERCRRVLERASEVAPTTAEQWRSLARSLEVVFEGEPHPQERTDFRILRGRSGDSPD